MRERLCRRLVAMLPDTLRLLLCRAPQHSLVAPSTLVTAAPVRRRRPLAARVIRPARRPRDSAAESHELTVAAPRRFRLIPFGRRRPAGGRRPYGR